MKTNSLLSSLHHVVRTLPHGGQVVVLDTGAVIGPEAEAMLQALHSRSTGGIFEHLETLEKKGGPEKFMKSIYVGYGHSSIGDCGSATVFIEGVSLLAAKAVQDWRLYSGQESSTRYIDFANQPFRDPIGTSESQNTLEAWRSFYLDSQEALRAHLRELYPPGDTEDPKRYEKAIAARSFDILRGFLPAGAATNLAWHSNLRQMADKLMILRHHPLAEVRDISDALESALTEAFPSSFGHKLYERTESYNAWWSASETYFDPGYATDFVVLSDNIDYPLLRMYAGMLASRPPKTELPKFLAECGTVQFGFMLDFGSFRDIQRHRAVTQRMPLLSAQYGFEPWYFTEMPPDMIASAHRLLDKQENRIRDLSCPAPVAQYYTALGYRVPNRITGDIPALVYLAELRAASTVHPTLAFRARQIADELVSRFGPCGLAIHLGSEPGRFDTRRGDHDIVDKDRQPEPVH